MANDNDTIDLMRENAQLSGRVDQLEFALANLVEWAKGNRGSKAGNPYLIPEVRTALLTLCPVQGLDPSDCNDVNTQKIVAKFLGGN